MFKKMFKLLKNIKRLNNKDIKNYIILECLSTLSCKCGEIYTTGEMLGTNVTLEHEPTKKCQNNTRKYKLIPCVQDE